jgi:hypothetical protein
MVPCILTLTLDRGAGSASYTSCFTPGERTTLPTREEAGVSLDVLVKRKVSVLCP